jgi:membrane protein DedA with SNARE-associated domain
VDIDPARWLPGHQHIVLLHVLVAVATLIDATGLPFPGRVLLIAAGASTTDPWRVATLTAAGSLGAVVGDHLWYAAGRLGGRRLLNAYCRLSMGSGQCVSRTRDHFRRYGPFTIVIGRFVAGVRLFASPLAGTGAISYPRYLAWDVLGAIAWAGGFVALGYLLGDRWRAVVQHIGLGRAMLIAGLILLVGTAATIGWRLWRRRRHGPVRQLA